MPKFVLEKAANFDSFFDENDQNLKQKIEEICKKEYPYIDNLMIEMYQHQNLPSSVYRIHDGSINLDSHIPKNLSIREWPLYYNKNSEENIIAKIKLVD